MSPSKSISGVVCMLLLSCGLALGNSQDDEIPTPEERLQAAGIDTSFDSLVSLLFDRTAASETRCLSAIALGKTKDSRALPVLQSVIDVAAESDAEVRNAAAIGLGRLGSGDAVPALDALLTTDPNSDVRYAAVQALEAIGGPTAVDALLKTATRRTETELNRISAIDSVGRLSPVMIRSASQSLLVDRNPSIRAKAAVVLASVDESLAVPHLVHAAVDQNVQDWIQDDAILALQQVTGQSFLPESDSVLQFTTQQKRAVAVLNIHAWWDDNQDSYGR